MRDRLTKAWGKDNCNCVPTKLDYVELIDINNDEFLKIDEIVRKLAEYENTELSPQDVMLLRKMYDGAVEQIDKMKEERTWILCSERLPDAEKEVELSIKRVMDDKTYYFTVRGFYEDGSVWNDESFCNWEYDKTIHDLDEERDDFKIPECWCELSTYADEDSVHVIDDFVTAWRELPEPYKGEE